MLEQVNVENIATHISTIMKVLGVEITESNKDTPKRIAKMWANEVFSTLNKDPYDDGELVSQITTFPNEGSDMVIVKDIPFTSMCEHHWMPFSGTVDVGYVPTNRIIGLSKVPRVVKYFSKRPQLQERLGDDIADFLNNVTSADVVFVRIKAKHTCVSARGVESPCETVTHHRISCTLSDSEINKYEEAFERRLKE